MLAASSDQREAPPVVPPVAAPGVAVPIAPAPLPLIVPDEPVCVHDGLSAVSAAAGPGTRLIALTGWGQDKEREPASAAGFDAHWVEPVSLDKLKSLGNDERGAGIA